MPSRLLPRAPTELVLDAHALSVTGDPPGAGRVALGACTLEALTHALAQLDGRFGPGTRIALTIGRAWSAVAVVPSLDRVRRGERLALARATIARALGDDVKRSVALSRMRQDGSALAAAVDERLITLVRDWGTRNRVRLVAFEPMISRALALAGGAGEARWIVALEHGDAVLALDGARGWHVVRAKSVEPTQIDGLARLMLQTERSLGLAPGRPASVLAARPLALDALRAGGRSVTALMASPGGG